MKDETQKTKRMSTSSKIEALGDAIKQGEEVIRMLTEKKKSVELRNEMLKGVKKQLEEEVKHE